jgi:hypothetical protein
VAGRDDPLEGVLAYPLMHAMFGRRSRRFGLGMEIPTGPLAFTSRHAPVPLSDLERSMLVAAGTGVSGFHWGVPFAPNRPTELASAAVRFTGRTGPTAGGFGTMALFHTSDDGTYLTNTRDVQPGSVREFDGEVDAAERIISVCREHTVRLSDRRLDVPPTSTHFLEPNLWMANAPGSTMFLPVAEASEQFLATLGILIGSGYVIMDDDAKRPAGDLDRFVRSGLLDDGHPFPLSVIQQVVYEGNSAELAFMAHNIVLTMQAMGLGGLFYSGVSRWSLLGALADEGVHGLGFRFVEDERWTTPNPVGLDGHYESLSPPYYPDMRAAVEAFVERKFGHGGSYDPDVPGAWKDSAAVKKTVTPYSEEFVDCMAEIAEYVYRKHGKFPGTITTIVLNGIVQAQHIDTEFYDAHYQQGAYLQTHAEHMDTWHGDDPVAGPG